ncbi:MAG TPA: glycine betaine ABC transporter substrate-binding protein [Atribacterota bacterium]|nr:glycine betaine ABC transporter substrate-binding protein [Atribacterota bacterium]
MKRIRKIILLILVILIFAVLSSLAQTQDKKIVMGSKLFNEQYILSHMIAHLLTDAGYQAEVKTALGGTMINYEALKQGNIDAYVEYTGTAYNVILKFPPLEQWNPEKVYQQVEEGLLEQDQISIAAKIGFSNDYAIALKKDWVEENQITKLSELGPFASDLSLATDPEFASRPDGLPQIDKIYGFTFGRVRQMQPTLMYEAIKNNQVDAIGAYTTDARVDLYNLAIVEDDLGALPPYDAIMIVRKEFAENEELMNIFKILEDQIDTQIMRHLNKFYDIDKKEASDIAREYLVEKGFIK